MPAILNPWLSASYDYYYFFQSKKQDVLDYHRIFTSRSTHSVLAYVKTPFFKKNISILAVHLFSESGYTHCNFGRLIHIY